MIKLNPFQVTGCGKKSGLQLILDSQKMHTLLSKDVRKRGYYVFITVPGVVTSKIPFLVDPEFEGEHNFYIHGIHVIGVSYLTGIMHPVILLITLVFLVNKS